VIAELGVVIVVDRIGKKRSVTGSLVVALLGYVLLLGAGANALWLALAALAIAFFGFEFSVVAGISILSEQMPAARGAMLALGVTAGGLGRTLGDVAGAALFEGAGFALATGVSAAVAVFTLLLFVRAVKE
jgi:MFS family permease